MIVRYFVVAGCPKSYTILESYETRDEASERCPKCGFIVEVRVNVGEREREA